MQHAGKRIQIQVMWPSQKKNDHLYQFEVWLVAKIRSHKLKRSFKNDVEGMKAEGDTPGMPDVVDKPSGGVIGLLSMKEDAHLMTLIKPKPLQTPPFLPSTLPLLMSCSNLRKALSTLLWRDRSNMTDLVKFFPLCPNLYLITFF